MRFSKIYVWSILVFVGKVWHLFEVFNESIESISFKRC
jgi:hypothetical protein